MSQEFQNLKAAVTYFQSMQNFQNSVYNEYRSRQNTGGYQNQNQGGYQGQNQGYVPNRSNNPTTGGRNGGRFQGQGRGNGAGRQQNQQNQNRNQGNYAQQPEDPPIAVFADQGCSFVGEEPVYMTQDLSLEWGDPNGGNEPQQPTSTIVAQQGSLRSQQEASSTFHIENEADQAAVMQVLAALKRQRMDGGDQTKQPKVPQQGAKYQGMQHKDYDILQQLGHTKVNLTVLEALFQEPFRTQILNSLKGQQSFEQFKDMYTRSQQDKYFAQLQKEWEENNAFQARQLQFQRAQQQMQLQGQQGQLRPLEQSNPPAFGQQGQQPAEAPKKEEDQMQQYMYTVVYNIADIKAFYDDYIYKNSKVPDYASLKAYQKAQLDFGSHYTIISQNLVRALGLQNQVVPSNRRYIVASGESQAFQGQLEAVPFTIGECTIKVTLQVTPATSYPMLIGSDVFKLLRLDILTSQGKIMMFNKNEQGSYLPFYTEYTQIPGDIVKGLKSFQGVYPAQMFSK